MKPGHKIFASDEVWLKEPNAGSDTKAEYTAAEEEEGFVADEAVAPDTWNMWRWRVSQLMRNASAIRCMNLFEGNKSGLQTVADSGYNLTNKVFGVYCPVNKIHTLVGSNLTADDNREFWGTGHHIWYSDLSAGSQQGSTINYGAPGAGQVQWLPSYNNALPSTHPNQPGSFLINLEITGIDINTSGTRVIATNNSGGIYYSTNFGYWTYWTGSVGSVGQDWGAVHTDKNGKWVFWNSWDADLYLATSINGTLTQLTSPSISGTGKSTLWHTHHWPGHLHPDDPGNPCWLFFGGTTGAGTKARSFDGLTWETFTPQRWDTTTESYTSHTVSFLREGTVRYSAYGGRWGYISDTHEGATDVLTFVYSDDNGCSWTEVDDSFLFDFEGIYYNDCGDCNLETDGYGNWLCAIQVNDGADEHTRFFASVDNGITWKRFFSSAGNPTYFPNTGEELNDVGTALWYGEGAFHFFFYGQVGSAGNAVFQPMSTLRVIE